MRSVYLMKQEDFKVGIIFRTSTGEWVVTQVDDLKVMAKPLWRWAKGFNKEHLSENFPAISFTRKHWPACITIEEWKQSRSSRRHKSNRIPCYRCYNNDRAVPATILEIGCFETIDDQKISRGTTVLMCARCKKSEEKSCLTFGKYKWICQCGTNMWWDDPKTDELTRMQEGFICAASFDSSFKHIRPVIPNKRLSTSLLKENGGIFGIGAKVDLGTVIPHSEIPRIEDVVFDPSQARFIDTLDPTKGCLLPSRPASLFIRERTNKLPQVRIILKDPQFDNELDFSVTDIRFFNLNDHVTINTNTVNAINKKLHSEQVILSVGLTYPYPPGKEQRSLR